MSKIIESLRVELSVLNKAGAASQAKLCKCDASYDLAALDLPKKRSSSMKNTSRSKDKKMHNDFLRNTIKTMQLNSPLERANLSKKLEGKVFHVTTLSNFELILASGAVLHNQTGRFPHRSGFKNACFNSLAHVSVCDFFHNKSIPIEKYINEYNIFFDGAVFLFLHPSIFANLMTWKQGCTKTGLAYQIVPFLESGYPEKIHLSDIIDAWQIQLHGSLKPNPDLIDKLQKAMERSTLAYQERNPKKN